MWKSIWLLLYTHENEFSLCQGSVCSLFAPEMVQCDSHISKIPIKHWNCCKFLYVCRSLSAPPPSSMYINFMSLLMIRIATTSALMPLSSCPLGCVPLVSWHWYLPSLSYRINLDSKWKGALRTWKMVPSHCNSATGRAGAQDRKQKNDTKPKSSLWTILAPSLTSHGPKKAVSSSEWKIYLSLGPPAMLCGNTRGWDTSVLLIVASKCVIKLAKFRQETDERIRGFSGTNVLGIEQSTSERKHSPRILASLPPAVWRERMCLQKKKDTCLHTSPKLEHSWFTCLKDNLAPCSSEILIHFLISSGKKWVLLSLQT